VPDEAEALPGREAAMPVPARHAVKDAPLKPPFPGDMETALFAMGCFWGAEKLFRQAPGVDTTAVGFTPNPTYEGLLRLFWEHHDPTQGMRQGNDLGTQYRSAIWTFSEAQRKSAEASRDAYQRELSAAGYGDITTEIADAPPFYYAEDYHQQYLHKVPNGYCPDHGTGVSCPVGTG
jgi:peptide-methionine (S)-S-oxide reductase